MSNYGFRSTTGGVALVQVLFMVALLTSLVSVIQLNQRRQIDLTLQTMKAEQARTYLLSGESIAMSGLKADGQQSEIDSSDELWNQPFGPLPLDAGREGTTWQGFISVSITDLNGLVNLNWLHADSPAAQSAQAGFSNVLSARGMASDFAASLSDWFNPDSSAQYRYRSEDPSVYPGLRPMHDVSEAFVVENFDLESWQELRGMVTALPPDSLLNINTASPEALRTIAPDLLTETIDRILAEKDIEPFLSIDNMIDRSELSAEELAALPLNELSVSSEYFNVEIIVTLDNQDYYLNSLVYRDTDNKLNLIKRRLSRRPI